VFVRAQIVDPELQMPMRLALHGFFGGWFAIKKENVGLDALRIEDAVGRRSKV
jgi:hypothetical protein